MCGEVQDGHELVQAKIAAKMTVNTAFSTITILLPPRLFDPTPLEFPTVEIAGVLDGETAVTWDTAWVLDAMPDPPLFTVVVTLTSLDNALAVETTGPFVAGEGAYEDWSAERLLLLPLPFPLLPLA